MVTGRNTKKVTGKKPSKKEMADLQNKYKDLFVDVVNVIKKEKNVAVVYQVLVDILMQIESQVKMQCGDNDCSSCQGCK